LQAHFEAGSRAVEAAFSASAASTCINIALQRRFLKTAGRKKRKMIAHEDVRAQDAAGMPKIRKTAGFMSDN
jgi:hypothetical protein